MQHARSSAPTGLSISVRGDELDVTYRGSSGPFSFGEAPYLCCDLQTFLEGGEGGVWSARIRVPNLDRAVLDISIANTSPPPHPLSFEGDRADHHAVRAGGPAQIALRSTLHSKALNEDREVYIFRGKRCEHSASDCTLIVLADGENLDTFLANPPQPTDGLLDGLILVGVAGPPDTDGGEARIAELLLAANQPAFQRFEAFVLEEVIPYVEGAAHAKSRWSGGESNGGAWAVDIALRHPKVFAGALGFSIGSFTKDWLAPERPPAPAPTFLLGGGSLEPEGFGRRIHLITTRLAALGLHAEERQFTGGHSMSTWNALFWSYLPEVVSPPNS